MTAPTPTRKRGRPRKVASDSLGHTRKGTSDEGARCMNELPEFFKIYIPTFCSNSMRIPPEFLKKFGGNIPTDVTLKIPSGLSWQVRMHQISEHWFFQKGWPEFVLENSVEDGDFLIFSYAGDSEFSVKVFARSGCRKRFDKTSMTDEESGYNTPGEEETSESEDNDHNQAKRRHVRPNCLTAEKTMGRNPSFSVTQTRHYIERHYMNIPSTFWRVHMRRLEYGSSTSATLCIKNNSWEVGLSVTAGRIRFTKGFHKFLEDNPMKPGDLCDFEMIDGENLFFKVTIHR